MKTEISRSTRCMFRGNIFLGNGVIKRIEKGVTTETQEQVAPWSGNIVWDSIFGDVDWQIRLTELEGV